MSHAVHQRNERDPIHVNTRTDGSVGVIAVNPAHGPPLQRLFATPLEDRRVLSVTAGINGMGDLVITGDGMDNQVDISLDAAGQIVVAHDDGTDVFDPADITSGRIEIDLQGGEDRLTLPLIQNDDVAFQIQVDMGGGNNEIDRVFLEENVGSGALLPALDLSSSSIEEIHLGGAGGDTYSTSGLTLSGNVIVEGSADISTNGGDFDATDARLSAAGEDLDLTIDTGMGNATIGATDDAGGALINKLEVDSQGDVRFARTGNNMFVEVGSLEVHGATITIEDSISVTNGEASFDSDGLMTFDPDPGAGNMGADIVIDTHGQDLTLISGVTGGPSFSTVRTTFVSSGMDGADAGGTVTLRPALDATPVEIGVPDAPAMPDPSALQVDASLFGLFSGFDGIEVGSAQQSGTISVFDPLDVGIDLHLHAGMGDIVIGSPVTAVGDVTVTGDGNTTTINANMAGASLTFNDDVRIGSSVKLTSNVGDITFNSTVDSEDMETNDLTLDAAGNVLFADTVGADDALDDLTIDTADDVTFSDTLRLAGDLTQTTGSGTTTFNGTSGTGIGGELDVTTDAVVFNTADVVVVGPVTVEAENAITLNAGAGINAGASTISLLANQDDMGGEDFTQNGTAVVQTTNSTAAAVSIGVGGTGDALIGDIRASAAATGTVVIDSAGGAIIDNLAGVAPNVIANQVALDAATGIGTDADALEINADVLAARTVAGDLHVVDTAGGLTIGMVGGLTGARITAGAAGNNLRVAANSPLTVNSAVSNAGGGDVTLVAGGATAADDLLINANVTTTGGNGSISLFAGDSIQVAMGADVEASGTGSVLFSAGTDASLAVPANGTAAGAIAIGDGSEVTSDDGNVTLRAPGDVRISQINANDDGDMVIGDVFVQADFAGVAGGLSDAMGAIFDDLVAETPNIVADQAELRAATGIGSLDDIDTSVNSIVAVNTTSGDITVGEANSVNILEVAQVGAGNVQLTAAAGSITIASAGSGITAGTGTVTLTATGMTSDITLQQDVTTAATGNVVLSAGRDVLDDGSAATRITTGNLSLSARRNIGDVASFAAGTGTPVDISLSGQLLQAVITDAAGEVFVRADGNLTAAAGAINPDADGAATALITATGNLDVGTFGGVTVTPGDNLGLLAGGTLTLPAGGYDVGGGNLRLRGNTDVQDGDQFLGPYVADSLEFVSGSAVATFLTTDVNSLTAEMTTLGTSLTVLEQDGILLNSVTTNDGDLVVVAASPGNISVRSVDAGSGLAAIVAAPLAFFTGDGAILDADGPGPDNVDVTGGEVLLLATQGIGTAADALEIDGGALAAATVSGDINLVDVAGGLTVGTVEGFVGVQITGGALGDDIDLAAEGAGANLAVETFVSTVGSGDVSLTADNDVNLAATGQITTVAGDVNVDADGGITMVEGSQVVTTGGSVELEAQNNIVVSRVQATMSNVIVNSTGGAIADGGDLLGANISANQAALSAATGIGAGNPLETAVNLLSASNSTTGEIAISNVTDSLFGAPLTIGTFGGLSGVENTAPGGAVSVSNFGSIDVEATVASAGDVMLTAQTPLLLPLIPGDLTLNAPVVAGGDAALNAGNDLVLNDTGLMNDARVAAMGDVVLNAGRDLVLNDTGVGNEVRGATVTGNAGNLVTFGPDVLVRSDTGAVADKLPEVTILSPTMDNDPVVVGMLPFAEVRLNIGRPGELNLQVQADFNGQIVTDTFDGENMDAVLNGFIPEGGAGFFINVTVTDDPNITFSEGGVVLERAPDVFQFDPVFIPFLVELPRAEPPTPSAPEPVEMATITPDVNPYLQLNTTEDLPVPPDAPASADVRIIIVEKIGPDGDVEVDRNDRKMTRDYVDRAAEEILEDPFKLFEKLKSGRFRVWLKDGLHAEPNLIWDVILRDGRPQAGGEGTLRLPTEAPGETADEVPGPGGDASTPETSQPGADDAASESATSPAAAGSAPPAASEVAPRLQAAPAQADPESNAEAQRDARPGAAAAGVLFLPAALRSFAGNGWRTARRVGSALASLVRSA